LLPLRFPALWSSIVWLLTLGVIVGSLIPSELAALASFGIRDKILHAAGYLLLMVCFAGVYRRSVYPIIAFGLLALGIGLELLQLMTETRSFDWYDVAMNGSGVVAGFVLSWLLIGGWCQRVEQRLLS